MIDSNYTIKPKAQKKFQPIPSDKYQVQITDINLIKVANQFKGGEEEDRLNFEFTVLTDNKIDIINDDGEKEIESTRGRRLWKRIAPSNSPAGKKSKASWFYKLLCAVEKKELSEDELTEIAPATLIGQQLIVWVEVAGEWNNILNFQTVEKDLPGVPNADERAESEQIQEEELDEVADKLKGKKAEDLKEKELDEVFAKR